MYVMDVGERQRRATEGGGGVRRWQEVLDGEGKPPEVVIKHVAHLEAFRQRLAGGLLLARALNRTVVLPTLWSSTVCSARPSQAKPGHALLVVHTIRAHEG